MAMLTGLQTLMQTSTGPGGVTPPSHHHLNGRYLLLVEIEAAFRNLKDDLQLRPLYHQLEHRIEAHISTACT